MEPFHGEGRFTLLQHSLGWETAEGQYEFAENGELGAPVLVDSGTSFLVVAQPIFEFLFGEEGGMLDHKMEDASSRVAPALEGCEPYPGKETVRICDCPWEVDEPEGRGGPSSPAKTSSARRLSTEDGSNLGFLSSLALAAGFTAPDGAFPTTNVPASALG